MSSLIGRTLGRYEILDEISRGGMGVVSDRRRPHPSHQSEVASAVDPTQAAARRTFDVIALARSNSCEACVYSLGQIHERLGDRAKAAEYYQRFVEHWGDGEIDRERVAEARKKLN